MNFKLLLFLLIFSSYGCGVKSRPNSPPEAAIQSYTNSFLDTDNEKVVQPTLPQK